VISCAAEMQGFSYMRNVAFPAMLGVLVAIGFSCLEANAQTQRIEEGGIVVELSTALRSDGTGATSATVDFRIIDADNKAPYRGLTPRAWLARSKQNAAPSDAACKSSIQSFLQGGLATQPDADLNGFRLAALNDDASVSIINPTVSLGGSQLEHLITLPAPGSNILVHEQLLYVSIPDKDLIEVIDTIAGQVSRRISLPAGSKAGRLARDPRTGTIWISLDAASAVAAIKDTDDAKPEIIKTGTGLHRFAFPREGRDVYVSSSGADQVSIVDSDVWTVTARVPTGRTPVDISYGSASRQIYVANLNSEFVTVIDVATREAQANIAAERNATSISFEPEGRFAIILDNAKGGISILDSASNRITTSLAAAKAPDQAVFSRNYLYVHDLDQAGFLVFSLKEVRQGKLSPIRIETGTRAPSDSVAALESGVLAVAPDESSAFVANPSEKEFFYYAEGMMVPMGTLNAYGKKIMGLAVLNRGLTEKEPGHYSVDVSLRSGGSFDLPLLVEQPRLIHCFHVDLGKPSSTASSRERAGLYAEAMIPREGLIAGRRASVSFRIRDRATGDEVSGLIDAEALAHGPSAKWFGKRKVNATEAGLYGANWTFPTPGRYQILLSIPSRGINWTSLEPVVLDVRRVNP
jgi:YVTN family beta-propeller protein